MTHLVTVRNVIWKNRLQSVQIVNRNIIHLMDLIVQVSTQARVIYNMQQYIHFVYTYTNEMFEGQPNRIFERFINWHTEIVVLEHIYKVNIIS